MTAPAPDLVGRDAELARLVSDLERAAAGQGRVVLLAGEPGIGKSRLAEEVAAAAADRGLSVVWGRCWEAGGAPAYWPWIQVLRGLLRERPEDEARQWLVGRAAQLVQLVPEVAQVVEELRPLPSLEPEQARFRLLDAVSGALADAAMRRPICIILEDLHVADPSTLAVLELLAGQVRTNRLFVLGTLRGLQGELEPALARIARHAASVSLTPLGSEDVERYLRHATGAVPSRAAVEAIHASTEGNPLFLAEVTRLLVGQGGVERAAAVGVSIPGSIKQVVGERFVRLSPGTRELVDACAVLGREFDQTVLARLTERDAAEVARALDEAARAAVLQPVGGTRHRFTHILLREVAHAELDAEARARLHARAAQTLAGAGSEIAWSEVAHHWLEATVSGAAGSSGEAIDACGRAARDALERLAYAEAAQWFQAALDRSGEREPGRGDLWLGLADARIRNGEPEAGRGACERAVELARATDDADLLARAALQAGALFRFAHVDATLVRLLEEALAGLPERDSPLRARVMARLAAALQPAADVEVPFGIAREAIAMARRLDDEATLLATIRSACSALMDLAHPDERRTLNREYVELAHRLGDEAEAFRGNARLVFDCYELVDLAGAYAAIEACDQLAQSLDHPFFSWRVAAMQAMRAIREGRFDDADDWAEKARTLGEHAGDPNVEATLLLQRVGRLRQQGRDEDMVALLPRVGALFSDSSAIPVHRIVVAAELARIGRVDEAQAHLQPGDLDAVIAAGDRSIFVGLANYCLITGERELVPRMMARLEPFADLLTSGGALEMLWEEPAQLALALLHETAGDTDEADACFARGVEVARATGARPHEAWGSLWWGRALRARGANGRARPCLERAIELADEIGARTIRSQAEELLASTGAAPASPAISSPMARISMAREGDVWKIEHAGASFRLKDTKGLALLSRLVAEPGRELHVLDLIDPGGSKEIDRGDAGELLDAQARREYERRVEDLREELAEAESFNDTARAERAQAELDAIAGELARAVGLGGRARKAGSAAERARVNVQRRLRDAIRRIQAQDAGLGRHLERSVRTGAYCCYEPE